jgi:hypothetical protein
MTSLQTQIDIFVATPTLANAKALVVKATPAALTTVLADGVAQVEKAKALLADAKNPKKLKQAMQTELRARFKGMNIEVI